MTTAKPPLAPVTPLSPLSRRGLSTLLASLAAGVLSQASLPVMAQGAPVPPQARRAMDPAGFAAARTGFRTQLKMPVDPANRVALVPPRSGVFRSEPYAAEAGRMAALVTNDPKDGKKHPAIIWLTGGDSNTVSGESLTRPAPRDNDQTAAAYWKAGVVMYFPSLRGGNLNPGQREGFLGEVDDIIAAARHLATLPYVDPERIYLGGHSTGGTLVMLASEASPLFRATFAFGPVGAPEAYPEGLSPTGLSRASEAERLLRSPWYWMPSVSTRLLVIEGEDGNIEDLREMRTRNRNPRIAFHEVKGASHFSVLAPLNALLARKILADTGPASSITLSAQEIQDALGQR